MSLPDDDTNKIRDLSPIRKAFAPLSGVGSITRQDYDWLEKKFTESRSPDGERLSKMQGDLVEAAKASIDKSNPLQGNIDHSGKLKYYEYLRFVDQKVDEYRQTPGKNPRDLFTPGKPDYLGGDEIIKQFQVPIGQSIKNIERRYTAPGAIAPAAAPKPPRKPNESPDEYFKRTGG